MVYFIYTQNDVYTQTAGLSRYSVLDEVVVVYMLGAHRLETSVSVSKYQGHVQLDYGKQIGRVQQSGHIYNVSKVKIATMYFEHIL